MASNQGQVSPDKMTDEERRAFEKKAERLRVRIAQRRKHKEAGLTITSLMDAMTIILCFLLKSVGAEPLNISQSDDLRLPASTTTLNPEDTVPITVTASAILVGPDHVVDVRNGRVDKSQKKGDETSFVISPLLDKLTEEVKHQKDIASMAGHEWTGVATIVAHKDTPYRLLTEVMYTAGQAEFQNFKFAVVKLRGE